VLEIASVSLFSKRKDWSVQSFVLKLVNSNCLDRTANREDSRADRRVNLVVVVMIVPIQDQKLQIPKTFLATTKEFSNTGVAVVLDTPRQLDQAILGFQFEDKMTFIRAQAKHQDPIGGGFHQVGFHLLEVLAPGDYPELASMSL
jgi:hypothetical protein